MADFHAKIVGSMKRATEEVETDANGKRVHDGIIPEPKSPVKSSQRNFLELSTMSEYSLTITHAPAEAGGGVFSPSLRGVQVEIPDDEAANLRPVDLLVIQPDPIGSR
jgi:hypothetical protein